MAEGWAQELGQRLRPMPLVDPAAELAAFANADVARRISDSIDSMLKTPGAEDVSARLGGSERGDRVVEGEDGCTFLQPTVIHCVDPDHPLANLEYLFPFVSVVDASHDEIVERVTPSLVVSAVTDDASVCQRLLQFQCRTHRARLEDRIVRRCVGARCAGAARALWRCIPL